MSYLFRSLVFLSYSCLGFSAFASESFPYQGIFSKEIYNQEEVFRKQIRPDFNPKNGDVLNEQEKGSLLDALVKKKQEALEKLLEKEIKNNIGPIKEELEKKGLWADIANNLSSLDGWGRGIASTTVLLGTKAVRGAGGLLLSLFGSSPERTERQIKMGELTTKELTIQVRQNDLLHGIKQEAVFPYECEYVHKKPYIERERQEIIEEALLLARGPGRPFGNILEFIKETLSLPIYTKRLLKGDVDFAVQRRLHDFDKDKDFAVLDVEIRKKMKSLITHLLYSSINTSVSSSNRVLYYFYGNPGCGKSETAVKICKFLDLPYAVVPIRERSDLTQVSLEGSGWDTHVANKGYIMRPFLAKDEETGSTYLNGVLIINDFDRVLLMKDKASVGALGFLLDFLDPKKEEFWSPYFKSRINTRYLSILITGNSEIPNDTVSGLPERLVEEYKAYKPLHSRLTEIRFPDFSGESIQIVLGTHLEVLEGKYCHKFAEETKAELIAQAIDSDLRQAKKRLEFLVKEKIIEAMPSATQIYESGVQFQTGANDAEQDYKKALEYFKQALYLGYKEEDIYKRINSVGCEFYNKVKDYDNAFDCFNIVADKIPEGTYNVGLTYEYQKNNKTEAIVFYQKAAKREFKRAKEALVRLGVKNE